MKHPDYTQTKIAEELDWDVNTVKYYMNKPKKEFCNNASWDKPKRLLGSVV